MADWGDLVVYFSELDLIPALLALEDPAVLRPELLNSEDVSTDCNDSVDPAKSILLIVNCNLFDDYFIC